ncbi:MAG TPA: energy transducer TonB [Candidatus Acidoferrum sp.]|nr:energy transducer TonB [Candidatus Acidoferrum sp.]
MSDLRFSPGHLSACLIDDDKEAMRRGRRLRRKALAISLVLEAMALAAMLAWPLLYPSTLGAIFIATPVPPYRHGVEEKPRTLARQTPHRPIPAPAFMQPAVIPPRVDTRPTPPPTVPVDEPSTGDTISMGDYIGIDGGTNIGKGVNPPPPRLPERRTAPQPISEGLMEARLIHRVQPSYPRAAIAMQISGTVKLRAIISADGRIRELTALSGSPLLARAAIEAVSQWRYRPTLLNGQAVEVETLITVNFVLQ